MLRVRSAELTAEGWGDSTSPNLTSRSMSRKNRSPGGQSHPNSGSEPPKAKPSRDHWTTVSHGMTTTCGLVNAEDDAKVASIVDPLIAGPRWRQPGE